MFDDLQHLLINLARGLRYFHDVELLYPSDEFQTSWIFYSKHTKQKHQFYRVADTIKSDVFVFLFLYERSNLFEPRQMLLLLFCLNKDQFWFLLMLRISSAEAQQKQNLKGNANCSAPKTVIAMNKVANERYLSYLQLCGNVFL